MQRITVTLMNLYEAEPTLLDNMVLPTQLDYNDFIGRLMIDIGESEVCITNPRIMKIAVGVWSRGRLPVWQRLANVLDFDYNPIWNVDGETVHTGSTTGNRSYGRSRQEQEEEEYGRNRTETEKDSTGRTVIKRDIEVENSTSGKTGSETYGRDRTQEEGVNEATGKETTSGNTETKNGTTTTAGTDTTTGMISADNVETWSNDTKSETVKGGTETISETTQNAGSGTENGTLARTGSLTENIDDTRETTESINGNIQKEISGNEQFSESVTREAEEKIADTRTRDAQESISDTEESSGSDSWSEKRTGNIGVSTTQKMMTEEVEFWEKYDIIGYIINQFAHEFCLLVY